MNFLKKIVLCLFVIVGLSVAARFISAKEYATHPALDQEPVRQAAKRLERAIASDNSAQRRELVEQAAGLLEEDHYATKRLRTALEGDELLEDIQSIHESLTFRPWMEADLPTGFPRFTPLHHIEVKSYPQYRVARVEMDAKSQNDSGAFWTLFNHIKRNDIEMTAPVQTEYDKSEKQLSKTSMAFLYGQPKFGELGTDEQDKRVKVQEFPPGEVVSIGMRGEMTKKSIREARSKLLDWLKEYQGQYQQAGALRTMGYNSPFVARSKKYYEVQIPVSQVKPAND